MSNISTEQSFDRWIERYHELRPQYESFCIKLKGLLEELLASESINYQVVEARAKTVESFAVKLKRPDKSYEDPLSEISDLSGLRIIVYTLEDINKVCNLLQKEFNVDEERSSDKSTVLAADQFGYQSVHKVVSITDSRAQLTEWSLLKNLVAEIQVRTVLQHAWAAISHKLQYKREADIPYQLRRKLFRLSGLLELADEEFSDLRTKQHKLLADLTKRIDENDLDIPINLDSVREFVDKSETAQRIIKIGRDAGILRREEKNREVEDEDLEDDASDIVTVCEMVGIKELSELEQHLKTLSPKAEIFFKEYTNSVYSLSREINASIEFYAGPYSILATLIIGANIENITEEKLRKFGWKLDKDTRKASHVFSA